MRPFRFLMCVALLLAFTGMAQQPEQPQSPQSGEALRRAKVAAAVLQHWYVPETGLYRTAGWWRSANTITMLTDLMRTSGSHQYDDILANTLTHAQLAGRTGEMTGFPGFLNDYYDDEGWWALAWIDAYDHTGKAAYLSMAQSIFTDMTGGWDSTCGGGIWWSKKRAYKNAIANELFFSIAAQLANHSKGAQQQTYMDWAGKEWQWFQHTGMINGDHLINDGLKIDADGTCTNNGQAEWSYNQGVILGALTAWSRARHDDSLLKDARLIADATLIHLTGDTGILSDRCETSAQHCQGGGGDAIQFKGIFARNLQQLNTAVHDARYRSFLQANADSVWTKDRATDDTLGVAWTGPVYPPTSAASQSSAMDVLVAAAAETR